jgi:hypothetical protein
MPKLRRSFWRRRSWVPYPTQPVVCYLLQRLDSTAGGRGRVKPGARLMGTAATGRRPCLGPEVGCIVVEGVGSAGELHGTQVLLGALGRDVAQRRHHGTSAAHHMRKTKEKNKVRAKGQRVFSNRNVATNARVRQGARGLRGDALQDEGIVKAAVWDASQAAEPGVVPGHSGHAVVQRGVKGSVCQGHGPLPLNRVLLVLAEPEACIPARVRARGDGGRGGGRCAAWRIGQTYPRPRAVRGCKSQG